jgi:hypothetical protein
MAESLAHKWGQIIGNVLQACLREVFQEVADRHGLYLDYQRERPARAPKKPQPRTPKKVESEKTKKTDGVKVTWRDRYGNTHDLDYVFERGGTDDVIGLPAAFIEVAWRRYTKHSKNKAQEIEGAIIALSDTYSHVRPFLGIVLAGVFTARALAQLRSRDFKVAYFPYKDVLRAFASAGIDASSDESTPEAQFQQKIKKHKALTATQVAKLKKNLLFPPKTDEDEGRLPPEKTEMEEFLEALEASLSRGVLGFTITVLHGQPQQLGTVAEAIAYIQTYQETKGSRTPALKYEIDVRYNNGDVIHGIFQVKSDAITFLQTFA